MLALLFMSVVWGFICCCSVCLPPCKTPPPPQKNPLDNKTHLTCSGVVANLRGLLLFVNISTVFATRTCLFGALPAAGALLLVFLVFLRGVVRACLVLSGCLFVSIIALMRTH